jgi:hypothetical protein
MHQRKREAGPLERPQQRFDADRGARGNDKKARLVSKHGRKAPPVPPSDRQAVNAFLITGLFVALPSK